MLAALRDLVDDPTELADLTSKCHELFKISAKGGANIIQIAQITKLLVMQHNVKSRLVFSKMKRDFLSVLIKDLRHTIHFFTQCCDKKIL